MATWLATGRSVAMLFSLRVFFTMSSCCCRCEVEEDDDMMMMTRWRRMMI